MGSSDRMRGCFVLWKCLVACLFLEESQHPTWPQIRHIRRWTHESPTFKHSSQPFALGCTFLISLTCGHSSRSDIVSSLGQISLVPHHMDSLHLWTVRPAFR